MQKFAFALCLATLFTTGCAVTAKIPMNRFESPEANGKWLGAEAFLGYQGRNEVQLTDNIAARTPSVTDPSVETPSHRLIASGAIGLAERFDITLTLPQPRLGVKYQFIGNPRPMAKKGNFSLAASAGIGGNHETDSTANLTSTLTNTTTSYELTETQLDVGLIGGWRFEDQVMLYGGPFVVMDYLKSDFTPSVGAATRSSTGTIRSYGVSLGIQATIEEKGFVRVEGAGTKTLLGRANVGRAAYGLAVGLFL